MNYGNRQEEWRAEFAVDLGCGALLGLEMGTVEGAAMIGCTLHISCLFYSMLFLKFFKGLKSYWEDMLLA